MKTFDGNDEDTKTSTDENASSFQIKINYNSEEIIAEAGRRLSERVPSIKYEMYNDVIDSLRSSFRRVSTCSKSNSNNTKM